MLQNLTPNLITSPDGRISLNPQSQHQYGTRIRKNSLIKPSARLRHSPDPPRKIKPAPSHKPRPAVHTANSPPTSTSPFPQFPLPGVHLHPEDANSKVFLAIGRVFLSVGNRAMTIKDLAEMTLHFGLMCQNVSAAGQAITTYIRTHMQRCETQQDHPLLLRHVLSGTIADDDLLTALHSRAGGAHCPVNQENRITNFRRGTMVWYLSKATGVPCPFAQAGIKLSDYSENGKAGMLPGPRDRKRERDRLRRAEQCGQKRKRLRGGIDDDSDTDSDGDEQRPPKVKLTLRLKPRNSPTSDSSEVIDLSRESTYSDSSESTSSSQAAYNLTQDNDNYSKSNGESTPWSIPRRSDSVPFAAPTCNDSPPPLSSPSVSLAHPRRSPSLPHSDASLPPDSEDEDDDYHITMTGVRTRTGHGASDVEDVDWEADFESDDDEDGDADTRWDSPGPRSPSAPCDDTEASTILKESMDVRGMLDAWEDLDSSVYVGSRRRGAVNASVADIVAQAMSGMDKHPLDDIKVEELWDWDAIFESEGKWCNPEVDEIVPVIKQEDVESDSPFGEPTESVMSPADTCSSSSPFTPLSPDTPSTSTYSMYSGLSGLRRHCGLTWKDVELLGPDSVSPQEFEDGVWQNCRDIRVKTDHSKYVRDSFPAECQLGSPPVRTKHHSDSQSPPMSKLSSHDIRTPKEVVVRTCEPCIPAINAMQIEGISVYHTTLGQLSLVRRIDTDFVNLTPVITFLSRTSSSSTSLATPSLPNSVTITHGPAAVIGTWVPLSAAKAFAQQHADSLPEGLIDVFLSNELVIRFPEALREFHRGSEQGRKLEVFGPGFGGVTGAEVGQAVGDGIKVASSGQAKSSMKGEAEWDLGVDSNVHVGAHDPLLSIHPSFSLGFAALRAKSEDMIVPETPLSPTEEEMFQTLCVDPDLEDEEGSVMLVEERIRSRSPSSEVEIVSFVRASDSSRSSPNTLSTTDRHHRAALRRSKRVATASAAASRPRTRSRKKGGRRL